MGFVDQRDHYFDETRLVQTLYYIRAICCVLPILNLFWVLLLAWQYRRIRNLKLFFIIYYLLVSTLSQSINLIYWIFRIIDTNNNGKTISFFQKELFCNNTLNFKLFDSNLNCNLFTLLLFVAQATIVTAFLNLQINAFFAMLAPDFYVKHIKIKMLIPLFLILHIIDFLIAIFSWKEIQSIRTEPIWDWWWPGLFHAIDRYRFDFVARFSAISSWYLLAKLIALGVSFLLQGLAFLVMRFCAQNQTNRQHYGGRLATTNPVASSPFSRWHDDSDCERAVAVLITAATVVVIICYVATAIVYLLQGNSNLYQLLSISQSLFAVIAPIQLMWLNEDLRWAVQKQFGCHVIINDGDKDFIGYYGNQTSNGTTTTIGQLASSTESSVTSNSSLETSNATTQLIKQKSKQNANQTSHKASSLRLKSSATTNF